MNPKTIRVMAVVLLVLVALVAVKQLKPRPELYTEEAESLSISVDSAAVDRLVIRKGGDDAETVELRRSADGWQVPDRWNAPADGVQITGVFTALNGLRGELRADDPDVLTDFGIADDQGLHIEMWQGGAALAHVLIGRERPGWQGLFVRQSAADAVYATSSALQSALGIYGDIATASLDPARWVDLDLLEFETETVEAIELREPGSGWRALSAPLPFPRDETAVQRYLDEVGRLRAAEVVDPDGEGYGLDAPAWEWRLVRTEFEPLVVTVGAEVAGVATQRYVRVSGSPQVWVVAQYTLGQLQADGSRWLGANPLGVDRETLQRIVVSTPTRELSLDWPRVDEAEATLKEYVDVLEGFQVVQVDDIPPPAGEGWEQYILRIEAQGAEPIEIACAAPPEDELEDAIAVNRANGVPFLLDRATFNALFIDYEPLTPSEDGEAPAMAVEVVPLDTEILAPDATSDDFAEPTPADASLAPNPSSTPPNPDASAVMPLEPAPVSDEQPE